MARDLHEFTNKKLASMGEAIPIDPSARVVCRKCGHVCMLSRFHEIESVQAVYCKGCGSVIRRDGSPLTPPRPNK